MRSAVTAASSATGKSEVPARARRPCRRAAVVGQHRGQDARFGAVDRIRQLFAHSGGLLWCYARSAKGVLTGIVQRAYDRDDLRRGLPAP